MKTIVVIDKLNLGGVTTSLLNYLEFTSSQNIIDLLIFAPKKEDYTKVPSNVHILEPTKALSILGKTQTEVFQESAFLAIVRILLVLIAKLFNGRIARLILFAFIKKYKNYDLAISYMHDVTWNSLTTGCNDFVLYNISANYKAAFVHCDYKNYGGYNRKVSNIYNSFNKIICVSKGCKDSFLSCFPQLEHKTMSCENFTDSANILKKIKPAVPFKYRRFKIVTVCRIDKEKGIFRALNCFLQLYREGFNDFVWRIVGDGPDLEKLKEKVSKTGLEEFVEIVGRQEPPYPFMSMASFFLLPSFHEAAPMVFGECQVLGLPILTTETTSAKELVEDRKLGFVCDNSEIGIYEGLKRIFNGIDILPIINKDTSMDVNNFAHKQFNAFMSEVKSARTYS